MNGKLARACRKLCLNSMDEKHTYSGYRKMYKDCKKIFTMISKSIKYKNQKIK